MKTLGGTTMTSITFVDSSTNEARTIELDMPLSVTHCVHCGKPFQQRLLVDGRTQVFCVHDEDGIRGMERGLTCRDPTPHNLERLALLLNLDMTVFVVARTHV